MCFMLVPVPRYSVVLIPRCCLNASQAFLAAWVVSGTDALFGANSDSNFEAHGASDKLERKELVG